MISYWYPQIPLWTIHPNTVHGLGHNTRDSVPNKQQVSKGLPLNKCTRFGVTSCETKTFRLRRKRGTKQPKGGPPTGVTCGDPAETVSAVLKRDAEAPRHALGPQRRHLPHHLKMVRRRLSRALGCGGRARSSACHELLRRCFEWIDY